MRTMAATIVMVMGLVPGAGAWFSGAGMPAAARADQQTPAAQVVVLKVEGMT